MMKTRRIIAASVAAALAPLTAPPAALLANVDNTDAGTKSDNFDLKNGHGKKQQRFDLSGATYFTQSGAAAVNQAMLNVTASATKLRAQLTSVVQRIRGGLLSFGYRFQAICRSGLGASC